MVGLVDTREQRELSFPGFDVECATLRTGDYSVRINQIDYREIVAIERKSLSDLLGCIGTGRDRFERELERLALIPYRALVIEAGLPQCVAGNHRYSQLTPPQVTGSVLSWLFKFNVAPIFAHDRDHAARAIVNLLRLAAKYHVVEAVKLENEFRV